MKLITYQKNAHPKVGALVKDTVINLSAAYQAMSNDKESDFATTLISLLEDETSISKAAESIAYASQNPANITCQRADVALLPPVQKPNIVIALGRNYAAHAKEGGAEPPKYPMLFHKTAGSLIGHGQNIIIPPITEKTDYEAELAIIIGRTCKNISEVDALDYVAGYTIANDVSARDLQRRTSQFSAGKMVDTFGPLGPALVTKDEIADVGNLQIKSRLNGQLMQEGNTKDMIFSVPFIISYISQIATLRPGDVILTGTPAGVGFARTPPVFMKDGDIISVEIEGLGILTNPVIKA